jgi:carbon starvation protein
MRKLARTVIWLVVSVLGAFAYFALAVRRGEPVNSGFILIAAFCTYALGFRFYSKWIAARVLMLNDLRATPCEVHDDGKDFVRTNKWIVFGHHFAAISGPGPLVGPVLAAQFGYLPGTLWILIGCVLGGAVQDFVILFSSVRRDGKSLAQMVREELNTAAGVIGTLAILSIMIILLAVLALVVVKALAESPWGVFTVGATIPIAMLMGGYLRFWRVGKVREVSVLGAVLLLLAVWGGQYVHAHAAWARAFTLRDETLAWAIVIYGLAASVLPVWLLLAPRDYLSTFMKLGTIAALAVGVLLVLPGLKMPPLSRFADGSGLVLAGKLFPFCFITIACGAISGFHTLISSGVTPKIITREQYVRGIGYGAMCLESLVAIMAMIAACTLDPGVYLSMNVKGAGADAAAMAADTIARVTAVGFPVSLDQMTQLANQVGEKTLFGRTGGAATLAVGMANIFATVTGGRWVDLWYHFAIMFEALFILTTLDAGTRVGRYLLQDTLGNVWAPLGDTRRFSANLLASGLMVSGWGYFLIQGVRDPLGGVNSLWPLFGIANQMLAAIALCLATTLILKMQITPAADPKSQISNLKFPARPALALVTFIPLVWLLAVTVTAGVQKIWDPSPRIGFLAAARAFDVRLLALEQEYGASHERWDLEKIGATERDMRMLRAQRNNNLIDAAVAGTYLVLVTSILVLSLREWILLLARRRPATLHESAPVWLPEYARVEGQPWRVFSLLALALALAKELSGEAALERAAREPPVGDSATPDPHAICGTHPETTVDSSAAPQEERTRRALYVEVTERRYRGITRCC